MKKRSHIYRHKYYTFDIETTTIITGYNRVLKKPILNACIWSGQFYDGVNYTQVRSFEEVIKKLKEIEEESSMYENDKILIVVHNLSYEFQFIKDFFKWEQIVCTKERNIIQAETSQIIFRCSYFLSNMNLDKFLKNENVPEEFRKTKMDYDKERFPWTEITPEEYVYCSNDVIGLHIAIQNRIENVAGKDINNLPMTSTGYVRKDCRKAVAANKANRFRFKKEKLSLEYFRLNHKAFRGGNTHTNRRYSNKVLHNLGLKDVRSEYPAALLLYDYPTKFFEMKKFKQKEFDFYLKNHEKWAMLITVSFKDIRLKDPDATAVPYLSISKCEDIKYNFAAKSKEHALEIDNGRILKAKALTTTITEQDYLIIKEQYVAAGEAITRVLVSKKKPIPKELKEQILKYYYDKCTLKQDENNPDFDADIDYQYKQSKSRLNGIYGMHVTLPIKPEYLINNNDFSIWVDYPDEEEPKEVYAHSIFKDPSKTDEELLNDYYDSFSSFLSYQVGVWVTSYSRALLERGMNCCIREEKQKDGSIKRISDLVYCDTDSCKYLNPELHKAAFEKLNQEIIKLAEKRGAYVDYEGKRYHLGVFEDEGIALDFISFGAKKYLYSYIHTDKKTNKSYKDFSITISGVPKLKGKKCILEDILKGKLKSPFDLKKGYVFHSVKMTSEYMDYDSLQEFTLDDGNKIYFGSNVAMYPSSYTLGITADYEMLLFLFKDIMQGNEEEYTNEEVTGFDYELLLKNVKKDLKED